MIRKKQYSASNIQILEDIWKEPSAHTNGRFSYLRDSYDGTDSCDPRI